MYFAAYWIVLLGIPCLSLSAFAVACDQRAYRLTARGVRVAYGTSLTLVGVWLVLIFAMPTPMGGGLAAELRPALGSAMSPWSDSMTLPDQHHPIS